jgi:hypothetical protein
MSSSDFFSDHSIRFVVSPPSRGACEGMGRIGGHGRIAHELHQTEALALAALQRQADRKRRRGYQ